MASITKRGKYWRAQIRRRGYPTQFRTFDTKALAEAWARQLESEMCRGVFKSREEAERTTFAEALERYWSEVASKKRFPKLERYRINRWLRHSLSSYFLANLRGADFARFRDERRAAGKAENTIRLDLALVSHLFEVARKEWGMEGLTNPLKNIRKPSGSKERDRRLPVVVFGDHSRTLKFIDRPFARGADGTQVMVPTAGIEPLFFYYACKFIDVPARGYNRHFGQLKESSFNYPEDPAVQRKIAKCLSLVESAISAEEIRLKKIAELRLAVMAELFAQGLRGEAQKETEIGSVPQSWDVVPFSTVREWLQYGTSTRCSTETASYAVLRIPNIGSGAVIPDDLKYCDMPASEAAKYRLELGDLIFIRTNGVLERLGSCAVYRGAPQQALFASYLIRARLDLTRVEPRFVAHFYGSKLGTSLVAGRATPSLSDKFLRTTVRTTISFN